MLRTIDKLAPDASWSFADLTQKQTRYVTHGYYTYPAKFIPQLAARLIREFSCEGDIVVDPFMGSGTTAVEALLQARRAVGVDINPVAYLVARVKTTPLEPGRLAHEFDCLERDLSQIDQLPDLSAFQPHASIRVSKRIDYWFPPAQKQKLGVILGRISAVHDQATREFFLVAFSQILKACSIWDQGSTKPTRDRDKRLADPVAAFLRRSRYMLKHNQDFWDRVPAPVRDALSDYRTIECADARAVPCADGQAALVVTSPPYVTSYEYADLHQLTALWLDYVESLFDFRKRFIGSGAVGRAVSELNSPLALEICAEMGDSKRVPEVRNYFADMLECFQEMHRVLRPHGKACIVIGNTVLQGVLIANAQVFLEQMESVGFRTHDIIKREIPMKTLPQTRDPHNGRFTSSSDSKKIQAYPVEYILVMEKVVTERHKLEAKV